jgi:hypothetical protein
LIYRTDPFRFLALAPDTLLAIYRATTTRLRQLRGR